MTGFGKMNGEYVYQNRTPDINGRFLPIRTLIFYNLGIDQRAVPQNLKALLNKSPSIFFRIVARPHVHIALGYLQCL
jgi:hypothetical protein